MNHRASLRRSFRHLLLALSAIICFALKRFYQHAGPEELRWILAPTSWLSGWWTGRHFAYEAGFGYLSFEEHFVIAPECSGINFLVILFASLVAAAWLQDALRLTTFAAAGVLAVVATIFVNSARIALSLVHPTVFGLGATESHRLLGIVVFCSSLLVAHVLWTAWFLRSVRPRLWVAIAAYFGVTLVVPIAGGRSGPEFLQHAAWTIAISSALLALVWALTFILLPGALTIAHGSRQEALGCESLSSGSGWLW